MTDYPALNAQLSTLVRGVPHRIANLANAAALLYHTLEGLNWAGFYLLENDILVLGPFQGKLRQETFLLLLTLFLIPGLKKARREHIICALVIFYSI